MKPVQPAIHYFDSVSSTLDKGRELVKAGRLNLWDSVVAMSQNAGRGQLRRKWASPPGNLYAAMLLPPEAPFNSSAAAIAFGALCASALAELGAPVFLKWPNDLVVIRKGAPEKVGGILLEESDGATIAGIGINLASAPNESSMRPGHAIPAGTLADNISLSPQELWQRVVKGILKAYKSRLSCASAWRHMAEARLLWLNQPVKMDETGATGILRGIDAQGAALLENNGIITAHINGSMTSADMVTL